VHKQFAIRPLRPLHLIEYSPNFMLESSFIGLSLEAALRELGDCDVKIVETAPPRDENIGVAWRVLRCRKIEDAGVLRFELIVAREQIKEAHSRQRAVVSADNSNEICRL
jgi:hypothetical protein